MNRGIFSTAGRSATGLAIALALALAGCQFKAADAGTSTPRADHPLRNVWQPRVVSLRIYPSTRFIDYHGQPVLAADIQLLDAMSDPMKAPGQVRCELFSLTPGQSPRPAAGQRQSLWNVSLATLADQKKYYDPVTRGYLLHLTVKSAPAQGQPWLLRITFTTPAGRRLTTQARLPIRW